MRGIRATQLAQPMTARAIDEVSDDFVNDQYHELMAVGARRLTQEGFGHWVYLTGWSASTCWKHPENQELTTVVYYDGSFERPYQRDRRIANG